MCFIVTVYDGMLQDKIFIVKDIVIEADLKCEHLISIFALFHEFMKCHVLDPFLIICSKHVP